MRTEPALPLLDRRLVIVTGKGGTGKTTVAAALAWEASRRGKTVLVAEVGRHEQLPSLLSPGHAPVGTAGAEILPGLTALHIDPFDALAEYLGLQLHVRAIVDFVLRNKGFRQLLEASPGWRELITLGKVWHLAQLEGPGGAPLFELIIVDAPATGHGVTFLDVPRVVGQAVRAGPLRSHAGLVEAMIHDPDHTLLLPVALAEELPARETAELVGRVRSDIGVAVDRVVVNAVAPDPFPADQRDLDRRLAALPAQQRFGDLPRAGVLAECAGHLRARYELNQRHLHEIAKTCALPVVSLPYLRDGVRGPEDLDRLADSMLGAEPS